MPPSIRTIKAITWNISRCRGLESSIDPWKGGRPSERLDRAHEIGKFLLKHEVDLVFLNEVDFGSSWSGGIDHSELIAIAGKFPYLIKQWNENFSIPFLRIQGGSAILSRLPLIEATYQELPNPTGFQRWLFGYYNPWSDVQKKWKNEIASEPQYGIRGCAVVRLNVPECSPIYVTTLHMPSRSKLIQKATVERLLEIQRNNQGGWIIGGDVNLTPTHSLDLNQKNALDFLLSEGGFQIDFFALENPKAFSFPTVSPRIAIDWIMGTVPMELHDQKSLKSELSDHLPVFVNIVINPMH